jgi:hypothetical protein
LLSTLAVAVTAFYKTRLRADEGTDMTVSVDLSHFKPLDPGRINALDPVEVKYWCEQLHCTERELHEVISKVGDHVTAVRDRLASRE